MKKPTKKQLEELGFYFWSTMEYVQQDPNLSPQAKNLYVLLCLLSATNGMYEWDMDDSPVGVYPGHREIGKRMGLHKESVIPYMNELRDKKLIYWLKKKQGRQNIYYIKKNKELK